MKIQVYYRNNYPNPVHHPYKNSSNVSLSYLDTHINTRFFFILLMTRSKIYGSSWDIVVGGDWRHNGLLGELVQKQKSFRDYLFNKINIRLLVKTFFIDLQQKGSHFLNTSALLLSLCIYKGSNIFSSCVCECVRLANYCKETLKNI